jgi:hypothetical protein
LSHTEFTEKSKDYLTPATLEVAEAAEVAEERREERNT